MLDFFGLLKDLFNEQPVDESGLKSSFKFDADGIQFEYSIPDSDHTYIDENGNTTDEFEDLVGGTLQEHEAALELLKQGGVIGNIRVKFQFNTRHFIYGYDEETGHFVLEGEGNYPKHDVKESPINDGVTVTQQDEEGVTYFTNTSDGNEWWKDDPYAGSPATPSGQFADRLKERLADERADYDSHCHVEPEIWLSAIVETAESENDYTVKYSDGGVPVYIELDLDDLVDDFYTDSDDADYILENEKDKLDEFCDLICANLGFRKAEYYPLTNHDSFHGDVKTIILKLVF